jgi:uncharacterized protein YlzI (FlbEa/FlbD family)
MTNLKPPGKKAQSGFYVEAIGDATTWVRANSIELLESVPVFQGKVSTRITLKSGTAIVVTEEIENILDLIDECE